MTIDDLTERGFGLDVQFRSTGFDSRCCGSEMSKPWRVRLHTTKNQNAEYRLTAYGSTRDEAERRLVTMVEEAESEVMRSVRR